MSVKGRERVGRVASVGGSTMFWPLMAIMLLAGCSDRTGEGSGSESALSLPVHAFRPGDDLFVSLTLQAILERQARRDGEGVAAYLGSPDPAVRARAAFALGSVQDPALGPALLALLGDRDPRVRADAAFALGQVSASDGGTELARMLESEVDAGVRQELWGSIGKVGGAGALERAMGAATPEDEVNGAMAGALARAGARGLAVSGLEESLIRLLGSEAREARAAAALGIAELPLVETWRPFADVLRTALDEAGPEEASAPWIVLALGKLGDPADFERIGRVLHEGEGWQLRAGAAEAFGQWEGWVGIPGARRALLAALADPSDHVAILAASVLAQGVPVAELYPALEEVLRPGGERWRPAVPFLGPLVEAGHSADVLAWTALAPDPAARARGLRTLAEAGVLEAEGLFLDGMSSADPRVRSAAVEGVVALVPDRASDRSAIERFYSVLADEARGGPPAAALRAAEGLLLDPFQELFGSGAIVEEALAVRHMDPEVELVHGLGRALGRSGHAGGLALLEDLLTHGSYRVRQAAAHGLEVATGAAIPLETLRIPDRDPVVDGPALGHFGARPRLVVETSKGELHFILDAGQAPLTVLQLAEQVEFGMHDGRWIHAVTPGVRVDGGDVSMGDGTGGPGYAMRSEFTRIPFERGVIGMASEGKDTEGSRWFVTLTRRPELDGRYTAFGWLVRGWEVLDELGEGDQVLRVRVLPDSQLR